MRINQLTRQTINTLRFCFGATHPTAGPVAVHWDLTDACNSRCVHCQRWQRPVGDELDTEEGKRLIHSLASLGVRNLTFAGNEPLLRKDLVQLIAYAKTEGLVTSLNTNGLILNETRAKDLAASGLDMIYLSMDGATSETNDYLRGVPGALTKTLKAVGTLDAARNGSGPKIMVNFVVNRLNVAELSAAVDLAAKSGVDGMLIQPVHHVDTYFENIVDLAFHGEEDLNMLKMQLKAVKDNPLLPVSPEYFENFSTFYTDPRSLYRYRCVAAYTTIDIRANGDVVTCPVGYATLGNVREKPLKDIWYGTEANAIRDRIKDNQHPLCWFACVVPINVLLSNISHFRVRRLIDYRLIRHILRKVG